MRDGTLAARQRLLLEALRLRDLRALHLERARLLLLLHPALLQRLAPDERAHCALRLALETASAAPRVRAVGGVVDVRGGWDPAASASASGVRPRANASSVARNRLIVDVSSRSGVRALSYGPKS